ncbi:MAG TPA: hypothetical protein VF060_09795 [Trebonia sp.]
MASGGPPAPATALLNPEASPAAAVVAGLGEACRRRAMDTEASPRPVIAPTVT